MNADGLSLRASQLHFSSLVVDTHTDTPQRFLFDHFDMGARDSEGCVDIPRLREGGIGSIFFALWVPVNITGTAATQRAFDLLNAVTEQIAFHPADMVLAKSSDEIRAAHANHKIAIVLGIEGGHAINNDLQIMRQFAAQGVRTMTLTHNAATDWADSSSQPSRHNGLTDFGREVIQEMNRLGMLVDVSHVSDRTFYDVLETSRAPVIASHSCCRDICDATRNLTDDMILDLADKGGVMHITFHDAFLSQEYLSATRSLGSEWISRQEEIGKECGVNEAKKLLAGQRLSDAFTQAGKLPEVSWQKIVEHIDHAVSLVGVDHVGLGSDFDGAFMPQGMEDAAQFPKITEALIGLGYGDSEIQKILGENTLRVMRDCEEIARDVRFGNH